MDSLFSNPDLSHISFEEYEKIYEPDQDSFLFLDSLEKEYSFLLQQNPFFILEIGPGSGIISTFLSRIINTIHPTLTLAIDINADACKITKRTYDQNKICYGDAIQSNLLQCTLERLQNQVDVLLFNPPYVPTSSEELFRPSIESAYAGGKDGREVIDKLLPNVSSILSEKGVFYLLLEHNNKPDEVTSILAQQHLHSELIYKKQCRGEELMIIKYSKSLFVCFYQTYFKLKNMT